MKKKEQVKCVKSEHECEFLPGSPRRRPFQRQRAASETTDRTDEDSSPYRDDTFESFPHTPIQSGAFQSLSAESLSQPASASSLVFLRRYFSAHKPTT